MLRLNLNPVAPVMAYHYYYSWPPRTCQWFDHIVHHTAQLLHIFHFFVLLRPGPAHASMTPFPLPGLTPRHAKPAFSRHRQYFGEYQWRPESLRCEKSIIVQRLNLETFAERQSTTPLLPWTGVQRTTTTV